MEEAGPCESCATCGIRREENDVIVTTQFLPRRHQNYENENALNGTRIIDCFTLVRGLVDTSINHDRRRDGKGVESRV